MAEQTNEQEMPDFKVGDKLELKKLTVTEHSAQPPARYSEATLAAKLDELGIGRPSTLASIITVNQTRGYVKKKGQQLFPTWTGMKVAQYLEGKIPAFVDYGATATMEDELDKIENGALKKAAFLNSEWRKIQKDVLSLHSNINWAEVDKLGTIDLHNGYVVRVNSFGAWLEDTSTPLDANGKRKGVKLSEEENVAEFDFSDPEVCKKIYEASQNRAQSQELGILSSGTYAGWTVTARGGKYGPYLQALAPEVVEAYARGEKPPAKAPKGVNHKLPEGKTLEDVTLADVEGLFAEVKLPRNLSEQLFTGVGKKGNWLGYKASAKSRKATFISLPAEFDPRTITLAEAKKVWEEGKK